MEEAVSVKAFIGLGSNLGNGRTILRDAWAALGDVAGIVPERLSSPYLSAPVGMESRHWFTNAVGCLRVTLPALDLLKVLMAVEARFGRVRDGQIGYRDRSLDLDLLFYGETVMSEPELVLPHPRMSFRLFVLAPLLELEPGLKDPVTGSTVAAMEERLRLAIAAGEIEQQEIFRSCWHENSLGETERMPSGGSPHHQSDLHV